MAEKEGQDSIRQDSFRELQILEQQFQNLLMQKQQAQIEQLEVTNAREEVAKTKGEVYKIVGNAMVLSDQKTVLLELEQKAKNSQLRLDSMQKQEKELEGRIAQLQKQIQESFARDKGNKN